MKSVRFLQVLLLCPALLQAQVHPVPSQELTKRGFFQDFAELDLESLLKPDDLATSLATRSDLSLEEAPGVVTVVTADAIRRMGARTLADVLQTIPGFDLTIDHLGRQVITVRGVPAATANGSSEKVLILFNGQPLNTAIYGGATADNLQIPVGGLRKIEIQRGPGSAMYGGGAVLAVVNLVSDTSHSVTGTTATVGFGNYGTQDYELKFGGTLGGANLSGFVHYDRSDGDPLQIPVDTQTLRDPAQVVASLEKASLAPGTTNGGIKTVDTEYHVTFQNFDFNLRFKGESSDGYLGQADALGTSNELTGRQYAFNLGYSTVAGPYALQARVEYTRSENEQSLNVLPPKFALISETEGAVVFPSGVFLSTALGTQMFAIQGTAQRTLNDHHLEAGISLNRESTLNVAASGNLDFRTLTPYNTLVPLTGDVSDRARFTSGIWAEDTWKATQHLTLTGALRWDYIDDVGGVWSPQVGAVYPLPGGPVLKLLYGRSYRAPSFDELYFHLPGLDGNPNLNPETTDTVQGAVFWRRPDFVLNADAFFTAVHDLITTAGPYNVFSPQAYENGPGVHTAGVELEARYLFTGGDSVFLSYTFQDATDASTGVDVPGSARNLAYIGGDVLVSDWFYVTPSLLIRDSRPRAENDPRASLPAHGLLNLNLRSKKLYRTLQLTLTAQNLLGKVYADPSPLTGVPGDYPRPGRSVMLLVSYKF
jgi:iron complex outermembrane receptor protein